MRPFSTQYVVHGLDAGRALCGIRGVPREWPIGNLWVPLADKDKINCPGCLKKLKNTGGGPCAPPTT